MRRAAALLLAGLLVLGACGDDEGDEGGGAGDEAAADEAVEPECAPEEKPEAPVLTHPGPFPEDCLEPGTDYGAVMTTSEGAVTIDLLEGEAPITVNNFVNLARNGYFDGDDFHRVVPAFVIQGGDPTGEPPGTGGPGYTVPDELPGSVEAYGPGAVAMANAGPGTGGSQFFVCVDCSILPGPDYSLFGQVTEGLDVVEAINALGTGDGPPSRPVAIESVEITEG